ncbi:unnamed protein product, partial [Didymodactylos carnosus]
MKQNDSETLNRIGLTYRKQLEYQLAINYFQVALETTQDLPSIAVIY